MSDAPAPRLTAIRIGARGVLWCHAALWAVFAAGMIALALADPGSAENPVFLQVTAASCLVAVGSVVAALRRGWGAALALIGGCAFMLAWIVGNSGQGYRLPVALLLGVFALAVLAERRTRISSPAR